MAQVQGRVEISYDVQTGGIAMTWVRTLAFTLTFTLVSQSQTSFRAGYQSCPDCSRPVTFTVTSSPQGIAYGSPGSTGTCTARRIRTAAP